MCWFQKALQTLRRIERNRHRNRLSTVRRADKYRVMDRGRIAEMAGTMSW